MKKIMAKIIEVVEKKDRELVSFIGDLSMVF